VVLLSQCAPCLWGHGRDKYLRWRGNEGQKEQVVHAKLVQEKQTPHLISFLWHAIKPLGLVHCNFRMACMLGVLECRLQRLIGPLVDLDSSSPWPWCSLTRLRGYVIQGCNKLENWRFSDPNNNYNNQSELQGFSSSKPLGADYHYSPGVRHLQLCWVVWNK